MPIRADLRHFYGREWRTVVRPRILARAGGIFSHTGLYLGGACCEQCRVPDRAVVLRVAGWWRWNCLRRRRTPNTWWHRENGNPTVGNPPADRLVRIVITVAHVNHVAGDDRDENLRALCQWCHLNYGRLHHHETRSARKDAARPLFRQLSA